MTTYYKATSPDGTDFYSGSILYEVGKTVRPKRQKGVQPMICGPGFLHAADVPAETLVGGEWPCRLFEVTGKPHAGFDKRHPHKGGFKQLRVVRELPAHLALGPNGVEVARFIESWKVVTVEQAWALGAAQGAARDVAWSAARDVAWDVARDVAWGAAWALVVRDLITPEQFDTLTGPWVSVMGRTWEA
jgi:hypothetical protein